MKNCEEADTPPAVEDYLIIDDLRLVQPYYFDFKCFVKERWQGKRLVDLFTQEFPVLSRSYYERAAASGRLRIEAPSKGRNAGQAPPKDTPLSSGMCVRHLVHRHEPPVLAGKVEVLAVTADFVAVAKPACMPVHTVGQYRKNTVLGLLQAEHPELGQLMPTYRLDKPVSGLLLLARSSEVAGGVRIQLEEHQCKKVYVARVQGLFPGTDAELEACAQRSPHTRVAEWDGAGGLESQQHEQQHQQQQQQVVGAKGAEGAKQQGPALKCLEVDVPLDWDAKTNHVTAIPEGAVSNNSTKKGGKGACPACTQVRLLWHDPEGKTSVVECRPKTGRTHQIRVHLQFVGHPIANDTQYGGSYGAPLSFKLTRHHSIPRAQQPSSSQQMTQAPNSSPAQELTHRHSLPHAQHPRSSQNTAQPPEFSLAQATKTNQTSDKAQQAPRASAVAAQSGGFLCSHMNLSSDPPAVEQQQNKQQQQQQQQQQDKQGQRCSSDSILLLPPEGCESNTQQQLQHKQCDVQREGQVRHEQSEVWGSKRQRRGSPESRYTSHNTPPVQPTSGAAQPTGVAGVAAQPTDGVGQPTNVAAQSTDAAAQPTDAAAQPTDAAAQPTDVAAQPTDIAAPVDAQLALFPRLQVLYTDPRFRVEPGREEAVCPHCPGLVPRGYPIDLEPLWLHALRYSSPHWAFEAPKPAWADARFVPQASPLCGSQMDHAQCGE